MESHEDARAAIEANRPGYEALKREGQADAPRTLPPPSARGLALDEGAVLHRETIPGGWYWATMPRRGEALRINLAGPSAVSVAAWRIRDPSERLNYAYAVKVQWTTALGKGRVLLSDMGRVMLSIVEDSRGAHDALVGGSTAASNRERYGDYSLRNTRDNLVVAAAKHGLGRRDVPPCITFFAPVRTDGEGCFVWRDGARRCGDFVDLRAEMDLLVALSNCPHPLDPSPAYEPHPVEAVRFKVPSPGTDDLCRTASAEVARGFENTAALAHDGVGEMP